MTQRTLLTALLSNRAVVTQTAALEADSIRIALAADPALAGRARCAADATIELTGADGSAPPMSLKERQRWEMHVRLRLEAELGHAVATNARICWAEAVKPFAVAHDNKVD